MSGSIDMKHRLLTPHQSDIARAIIAVLDGCECDDAFRAMISVIAATINDKADDRYEAIQAAENLGDALVNIVVAGQDGELEMAP